MNKFVKMLFKFVLVIVQPIIALAFGLSWIFSESVVVVGTIGILLMVLSILSSVVLYAALDKITLLPTVKVTKQPQIGLSVGLCKGGFALLLPFVYLEFLYKKADGSLKL
jgi:hypothetical protein